MYIRKLINISLLSASLVTGSALADHVGKDAEGDMLYGHGMVAASPSEFVLAGPKLQNGLQGDMLYGEEKLFQVRGRRMNGL